MPLTAEDVDDLAEIVNIGVGRAASSLSELIGTRIDLRVPTVQAVDLSEAEQQFETGMSIMQAFDGEVAGNALLVFPKVSGQKLAALLNGYENHDEIPELEISGILSEVGNIVLNGVLGSLANTIETNLTYTVPEFYLQETISGLIQKQADSENNWQDATSVLYADAQFHVESEDIGGSIVIAFHLGSLESLLEHLLKFH